MDQTWNCLQVTHSLVGTCGGGVPYINHCDIGQSSLEIQSKFLGALQQHATFPKGKREDFIKDAQCNEFFLIPHSALLSLQGKIGRISSNFIIFNQSSHLKHD